MLILPMLFWYIFLKRLTERRNKNCDFGITRFYLGVELFWVLILQLEKHINATSYWYSNILGDIYEVHFRGQTDKPLCDNRPSAICQPFARPRRRDHNKHAFSTSDSSAAHTEGAGRLNSPWLAAHYYPPSWCHQRPIKGLPNVSLLSSTFWVHDSRLCSLFSLSKCSGDSQKWGKLLRKGPRWTFHASPSPWINSWMASFATAHLYHLLNFFILCFNKSTLYSLPWCYFV